MGHLACIEVLQEIGQSVLIAGMHSVAPDYYLSAFEPGQLPAIMSQAGEGSSTYQKGSKDIFEDVSLYHIRGYVKHIDQYLYPLNFVEVLEVEAAMIATYLKAIKNEKMSGCVANYQARVSFMPLNDGNYISSSGMLPRWPDLPPLEWGAEQIAGVELTVRMKTIWPLEDCEEIA